MNMTFGERVRTLRELAELTCAQLDRLARLGRGSVWKIENGERENPSLSTVKGLVAATGCTHGWLTAAEGDSPTKEEVLAAIKRASDSLPPESDEPAPEESAT